jgi:hypothetical protein
MPVRTIAARRTVRAWDIRLGVLSVLALVSCLRTGEPAGSAAELSDEPSLPVPFDLRDGVERARAVGSNLFVLDAATALASDAIAPRSTLPDAPAIGHYLAFLGGNEQGLPDGSVQVMFFTDEFVPRLAYRVRVVPGRESRSEVLEQQPPAVVHEPLMTLLSARQLALEARPPTQQAVNPVLLPQRNGQIVVYLMAATQQPNVAVLGRHFKVEVSSDGAEVENVTALSGGALEMPTRDGTGRRVPALAVRAPGTDHPTETHVFASRMANLPIYVTTGRGLWKVQASRIYFLGAP